MRHRLLTLAPSHYCERARWALDRVGAAYDEERLAPGPHVARTRRLGLRGSGLPILLRDRREPVQGSARILDWTALSGGDAEIERRLEKRIASLVRRCLYAGLSNTPGSGVRDVLMRGVVGRQRTAGLVMWPLTRRLIIRSMDTRAVLPPELIEAVGRELDWFDAVLAERGDHLAGRTFGRADLTAASLLAPLALPPTPPLGALNAGLSFPPLVDALARWAKRPSIGWIRRTYAAHRNAAISSAEPAADS